MVADGEFGDREWGIVDGLPKAFALNSVGTDFATFYLPTFYSSERSEVLPRMACG